jgi:hypothetical protein
MNRQQIFGYSGAAILALGTFTPIVNLPIVGSVNYFNNGQGDGVFILLLAVAAAALTGFGKVKLLWIPGALSAILLLITFSRFIQVINDAKSQLTDSLEGNPFAGLATGLMNSIQLQWGWMFLFIGAIGLIVSSFISNGTSISQEDSKESSPEEK